MSIACIALPAAGVEWRQVGPDGGTVTAIAAATSAQMVLAGTAEGRLFRSVDKAQTWERVGASLGTHQVLQIVISPSSAARVWVRTDEGIFRSSDRGTTFLQRLGGNVYQFAVAPSNPDVLYAATSASGNYALLKSADGGVTWTATAATTQFAPVEVAVDAIDSSIVYAAGYTIDSIPGIDGPSVWRSTDGGSSWQHTVVPGSVESIVAHPTRGGIAIATRLAGVAYRTTDGTTWSALNESGDGPVAFDPTVPGRVYLGWFRRGGGFYRSDDNGTSVHSLDNSRPAMNLVVDPADSNTLYAGAQGTGVIRSDDAGQSWATHNAQLGASEINWLTADPSNSNVVYAGRNGSVFQTRDRGASWATMLPSTRGSVLSEPGAVANLAVDPHDSRSLWTTSQLGLWHSRDDGGSWQYLIDFLGEYSHEGITNDALVGLAVDPNEPNTIWVAASGNYEAGSEGEIYKSIDGGKTFSNLAPKLGYGDFFRKLLIDPVTPGRIWIGGTHGYFNPMLLLSSDGGQTWTDVSAGLAGGGEVTALVVDPDNGRTVYVAAVGRDGVNTAPRMFRSDDSGSSWQMVGPGLATIASALDPAARITSMIVQRGLLSASIGPPLVYHPPDVGGVFVSADRGANWSDLSGAIGHRKVSQLLAGDPVLAATGGEGIFVQHQVGRERVVGR